jgi:hypothetical protein
MMFCKNSQSSCVICRATIQCPAPLETLGLTIRRLFRPQWIRFKTPATGKSEDVQTVKSAQAMKVLPSLVIVAMRALPRMNKKTPGDGSFTVVCRNAVFQALSLLARFIKGIQGDICSSARARDLVGIPLIESSKWQSSNSRSITDAHQGAHIPDTCASHSLPSLQRYLRDGDRSYRTFSYLYSEAVELSRIRCCLFSNDNPYKMTCESNLSLGTLEANYSLLPSRTGRVRGF